MSLKEEVADGDLDRQLIDLERCGSSIYDAVMVHVTEKRLTFTSFEHCYPGKDWSGKEYVPHKIQVSFEKLCSRGRDAVEIEVRKWERKIRAKRCNLGHDHDEDTYEFDHWQRMIMGWPQFEELLSWFQTGRYYDPRTRQAKANGGAFHSKDRIE